MCVFIANSDALAQTGDFRIERRQVVIHWWIQNANKAHLSRIYNRLNAHWQTACPIEDQAKNLNSIARLYEQRAFSPIDPTAGWLSHLLMAICMFVVIRDKMLFASCLLYILQYDHCLQVPPIYTRCVWRLESWKLRVISLNYQLTRFLLKKSMQTELTSYGLRTLVCGEKHRNFCIIQYWWCYFRYHNINHL